MSEAVILIHGLGRTHRSLRKISKNFSALGYRVFNESYPSTKQSIHESSRNLISSALEQLATEKHDKIHFITHSLGGLLVRYFLSNNTIENLGRIVMLAPPNHGSAIAEKYHSEWWFKLVTGPSGQQLTRDNPLFKQLKPLMTDVGIIVGNRSSDPWFNHAFDGEHDGKVSVESAKLEEEHSFKIVKCGHTLMMDNNIVLSNIISFVQSGEFR